MDTKQELERAKGDQDKLIADINKLEESKQEKLQELLRLDGEIRILNKLNNNEKET